MTGLIVGLIGIIIFIIIAIILRKVVPTNEVHILQKGSKTIIKGKGFDGGNVYYHFPQWVPLFGISVSKLPLYKFNIKLNNYCVYDNGKTPFNVNITTSFIINNQKIIIKNFTNFEELKKQLVKIVKLAVRRTIAQYYIQAIMEEKGEIEKKIYEEITNTIKKGGIELKNIKFINISDNDKL